MSPVTSAPVPPHPSLGDPAADWSGWTDDHLLARMAAGGADERNAAWAEFYQRHRPYLTFVCRRAYEGSLRPGLVDDVVHDTLVRAFERALTYDGADSDPDSSRRRARAWLGGIAANLFRSALRRTPDFATLESVDETAAPDSEDRPAPTARERALDEALAALSERERTVLRVTFLHVRPGAEHQRLSNAVSKALADELGVSPAGVRKMRERALRKVKSALAERGFTP
ncbi:sigma-70 family RNA polymerase sigma factor [Rubrivirga sp. S365]|uniref:RNA polymerase sigma factor n=1 Tax=Rubrivirga sp. S365 TaxID=3076080 RepID=UPI0028C675E4|nr:sigma-70 family RNA polymerase sigma factor [Rubrivirga sp. S365]MDT7858267.1 sigma-70 family RNA polymerase sigma factor [Rubrivirga sp. S365]